MANELIATGLFDDPDPEGVDTHGMLPLYAEVDDEDRTLARVVSGNGRAQWPMPTPCERCRSLPSVWSAGATMTSAFWNSLTVW